VGVVLVAFGFAGFSDLEEFLVASREDGRFFAGEFIDWGDAADRGVEAHGVVVFDEAGDQATGVLKAQGDAWADAIGFE
jgi:hypothetical protein